MEEHDYSRLWIDSYDLTFLATYLVIWYTIYQYILPYLIPTPPSQLKLQKEDPQQYAIKFMQYLTIYAQLFFHVIIVCTAILIYFKDHKFEFGIQKKDLFYENAIVCHTFAYFVNDLIFCLRGKLTMSGDVLFHHLTCMCCTALPIFFHAGSCETMAAILVGEITNPNMELMLIFIEYNYTGIFAFVNKAYFAFSFIVLRTHFVGIVTYYNMYSNLPLAHKMLVVGIYGLGFVWIYEIFITTAEILKGFMPGNKFMETLYEKMKIVDGYTKTKYIVIFAFCSRWLVDYLLGSDYYPKPQSGLFLWEIFF